MEIMPHFAAMFVIVGWWAGVAGGTMLMKGDPTWEDREIWVPAYIFLIGGVMLLGIAYRIG